MSQNLTISETGLKLIKAFEGYRPVDRELITGQRIVGYGHRLYSEDAVMMGKDQAEELLKSDLAPFEDMINSEVHAPMSQGQFDALCSFAFNIGPKAFLTSDTLRALNNGRPLDAANGLDIWRKSEIAGKTYVVDALMRRRTAEKALFLRTERDLPAGRSDIPPVRDTTISALSTEDALPVFTADDANGIVATAPYDAAVVPMNRRKEDGPAGALQLSERDILEDDVSVEAPWSDTDEDIFGVEVVPDQDDDIDLVGDLLADIPSEENNAIETDDVSDSSSRPSPIAAAATDIVARLDALIEDADARFEDRDVNWPESLITPEGEEMSQKVDDVSQEIAENTSSENIVRLQPKTRDQIDVSDVEASGIEARVVEDSEFTEAKPSSPKDVKVIDELAQDDAFRVRADSAAKYIQSTPPVLTTPATIPQEGGKGLWIPVILGFLLVGLAAGTMIRGAEVLLGQWGEIIVFSGLIIGGGLILAGIYAALRMNLTR